MTLLAEHAERRLAITAEPSKGSAPGSVGVAISGVVYGELETYNRPSPSA